VFSGIFSFAVVCAVTALVARFLVFVKRFLRFSRGISRFWLEFARVCRDNRRVRPIPGADARRFPVWRTTIVPVLLAAACMAPTLSGGFLRDDAAIIFGNPRAHDLRHLPEVWRSDWWAGYRSDMQSAPNPARDKLYRPLTLTTFALQNAVFGVRPLPLRIVNVLLHATATALVCVLAGRLVNNARIALIGGLLFAVHPIHVEAVGEIVGRAEILAAIFLMLGMLALLPPLGTPGVIRIGLAATAFFAAVLSKETGVCYPLLAIIILVHRYGEPDLDMLGTARRYGVRALVILAPLLVYLGLRYVALDHQLFRGAPLGNPLQPLTEQSLVSRVMAAFTILGEYTRLIVFPLKLSSDYGLGVVTPSAGPTPMTVVGAVSAIGLVWLIRAWRIRQPRDSAGASAAGDFVRTLGLFAALLVASYLLISNTFLVIGVTLAERLFYWPSVPALIGVAVAVTRFADRLKTRAARFGIASAGVLVIAALGIRSAARGFEWRDNHTLFEADVARYPESVMLNQWAAEGLTLRASEVPPGPQRSELLDRAALHLERAGRLAPGFPYRLLQMGIVAELRGDMSGAAELFEQTLQIHPGSADARARLERLKSGVP
jgi:hypothetical protein